MSDSKIEIQTLQTIPKDEAKALFKQAIQSNDLAKVKELVESKAVDINADFPEGRPIFLSTLNKDPQIFEYLIDKKPDLKISNLSQKIALAPWKNKNKYLTAALENGAPSLEYYFHAAAIGDLEELEIYISTELKREAPVTPPGKIFLTSYKPMLTPLHYAAANNQIAAMDLLLKNHHTKTHGNHSEEFRWMIGGGVNGGDGEGYTAFTWAIKNGHLEAAKHLKAAGANIEGSASIQHPSPLLIAAEAGDLKAVKWLVEEGANVKREYRNKKGRTPLLLAAQNGHLDIVRYLVKEGGSTINEHDSEGNTALLLATKHGHFDIVKFLLTETDADVDECNESKDTAWLLALQNRDFAMARWLAKEADANTDARNASDVGTLDFLEDNSTMEFLLQEGLIDVHARDEYGHTVLTHVIDRGDEKTAMMLVGQYGADPNLIDNRRQTSNNEEIALLLEQFGIDPNSDEAGNHRDSKELNTLHENYTKGVKDALNTHIDISALQKIILGYNQTAPAQTVSKENIERKMEELLAPFYDIRDDADNVRSLNPHKLLISNSLNALSDNISRRNPLTPKAVYREVSRFLKNHKEKIQDTQIPETLNTLIQGLCSLDKTLKPIAAETTGSAVQEKKGENNSPKILTDFFANDGGAQVTIQTTMTTQQPPAPDKVEQEERRLDDDSPTPK